MLGQLLDAEKVYLDGVRAECGEVFLRHIIGMPDESQLGTFCVQPFGLLPIGDEEDIVHPGGEFFDTAEPVPEVVPVAVS